MNKDGVHPLAYASLIAAFVVLWVIVAIGILSWISG